ncbi:UDP-N-acetylglucosamine transporter TMEM241 homolog isoform X2 [Anarhichas minor]|uniref:UDP-N-acetylglucosamine transporter TMEM241 homolog isoform X2 n=1 Tax=Anarhichas minor TaxID=65739 RepID=UPI003F7414E3
MQWRRHITGLAFSFVFVVSYFTNKFVLSVLKFTYPTLFQGWQTFIGAALLLLSGKFGWVEMSRITRSAALSWLPGSLLFVGNIYAGSRALSHIDIPFFFTLQNSSHVVSYIILKVVNRQEKTQWLKLISICFILLSAINLPLHDPQFDYSGYLWAVGHLLCVVTLNNIASTTCSAYCCWPLQPTQQIFVPLTGDLTGALEFPSLQSYTFHCGCCASALLGFLLMLATVKLKSGLSLEHFGVWIFLSKITAMSLSPFIFYMDMNASSLICVVTSHVGEALLVYSHRDSQLG